MDDLAHWIASKPMIAKRRRNRALWAAGAIYFDVGRGGEVELAARGRLACRRGCCARALATAVATVPGSARRHRPLLVLVDLTKAESRPRLGGQRGRAAARERRGDIVTIENVRNNEYRSFDDFTSRYETRSHRLANLKAADVIFFYWGSPWMSHPVLVFDFGPDGRVCMSVEVRYRKGQRYSLTRSLYRQQELIFLAADEPRRHPAPHEARSRQPGVPVPAERGRGRTPQHLPRLRRRDQQRPRAAPLVPRPVRELHDQLYRLPSSRWRCDWRVIANGRLDRALYEAGRLDRALPFEDLRRIAYINDIANAAPRGGIRGSPPQRNGKDSP